MTVLYPQHEFRPISTIVDDRSLTYNRIETRRLATELGYEAGDRGMAAAASRVAASVMASSVAVAVNRRYARSP